MRTSATIKPLAASLVLLLYIAALSIFTDLKAVNSTIPSHVDRSGVTSNVLSSSKDGQPTGLRLAFIGDSITRHQYLSLAYFLRHGKWFDPEQKPHLVNQQDFVGKYDTVRPSFLDGWSNFFNETNKMLAPMERCDCRRDKWNDVNKVDEAVVENRYFHDPKNNNTVVYIQAFGNMVSALHGHLLPEDALRDVALSKYEPDDSPYVWQYSDWGKAIEEYVSKLGATHIVMNAGFWPNDFGRNEESRENIVNALKKADIVGIWRTSTYRVKNSAHIMVPEAREADDAMVQLFGDNVLDVSWTRRLARHMLWDNKHFVEPIYRIMNEELLEMIGYRFPVKYVKQDLEPFCGWLRNDPEYHAEKAKKKNTSKK